MQPAYRWVCPDRGPSGPAELANWVIQNISDAAEICCHRRDLPALASTLLADRVSLPEHGIVQPGTVWVA